MGKRKIALWALLIMVLVLSGCTANSDRFIEEPAGFWAGLWHGLILFITFVISLFTESVRMYEVNNIGGWYDFGFLLGAMLALGHGGIWHPARHIKSEKSKREKEWQEIGAKVEEKVKRGIRNWVEESDDESEWQEIGKKVEEKIKRELRQWAED